MPTIRISAEVKAELNQAMLEEMHRDIQRQEVFLQAIRSKYGSSYSAYIKKLLDFYRAYRRKLKR